MTTPEPKKKPENKSEKAGSLTDMIGKAKKSKAVKKSTEYVEKHKQEVIIYFLLAIGVLTFFFWREDVGGLLIGFLSGLYFSSAIVGFAKEINTFVDAEGLFKSLIIAATALCFFKAAPWLFIGTAAAIGVRLIIKEQND